jgi:hypothetical protein
MKIFSHILILAASIGCVLFGAGCTTAAGTGSNISPETQKLIAHAAVSAATAEVIKNDPVKAAKVADIAASIKLLAGTEGYGTVDLLVDAIKIKANIASLQPSSQILANLLIDLLAQNLKERIGTGPLVGGNLLIVAEVAGWVEAQARTVAPPLPAPST